MAAGIHKFLIEQGASFSQTLVLKDGSDALIDLTGLTFTGKIRRTATSGDVIATFTCEVSSPETDGEVVVSMTATETAAIPVVKNSQASKQLTEYAYDIESVNGSDEVVRWLEGVVEVSPEVTR